MVTDQLPRESSGMATLVSGIIADVQELLKQQLTLFQQELQEDFRKTKNAVLPLIVGIVLVLVAGIILAAGLALLLNALWPALALWLCFVMAGAVWGLAAGVLVFLGKKKLDSFNPLPDETVGTLKENVQWLTKK